MPASEGSDKIIISGYRRLKQIGSGRFGEVYLCQEVSTERLRKMGARPMIGGDSAGSALGSVLGSG